MIKGLERFNFFLNKLELQLQDAAKDHNPALYLYKNDARTTLFMLEGLSRLYEKIHNKKKLGSMKNCTTRKSFTNLDCILNCWKTALAK